MSIWYDYVQEQAPKYGLDPKLAAAVMRQESRGNPEALSPAGAIGLMQLMPATGRQVAREIQLPYSGLDTLTDREREVQRSNRLELQVADLNIDLARRQVDLTERDFYPRVNLQGNYARRGEDWDVGGGEGRGSGVRSGRARGGGRRSRRRRGRDRSRAEQGRRGSSSGRP